MNAIITQLVVILTKTFSSRPEGYREVYVTIVNTLQLDGIASNVNTTTTKIRREILAILTSAFVCNDLTLVIASCIQNSRSEYFLYLACDCDPAGSQDGAICDSRTDPANGLISGRCHCKENVDGRRCDTCKNGFWNLNETNPLGCVRTYHQSSPSRSYFYLPAEVKYVICVFL